MADDLRQRYAEADACVFCAIVAGEAPATVVRSWRDAIAIVPLNPVTEGHTLVIPATHVKDATEDPRVSALTMQAAAEYAAGVGPCNVITSVGREATQTVLHLHLHVVPRRDGDGLALPWTPNASQEHAEKAERTLSTVRMIAQTWAIADQMTGEAASPHDTVLAEVGKTLLAALDEPAGDREHEPARPRHTGREEVPHVEP